MCLEDEWIKATQVIRVEQFNTVANALNKLKVTKRTRMFGIFSSAVNYVWYSLDGVSGNAIVPMRQEISPGVIGWGWIENDMWGTGWDNLYLTTTSNNFAQVIYYDYGQEVFERLYAKAK